MKFDQEKAYDDGAAEAAKPLIAFCKEHHMPLLISICFAVEESGALHGMMGCGGEKGWYPIEYAMARAIISGKLVPAGITAVLQNLEPNPSNN